MYAYPEWCNVLLCSRVRYALVLLRAQSCVFKKNTMEIKNVFVCDFIDFCDSPSCLTSSQKYIPRVKDVSSLDALHVNSARRKLWHTAEPEFHSGSDKSTGQWNSFYTSLSFVWTESAATPGNDEPIHQYGKYQPQSKLPELQKTRPPTFSHTDKPLEADDWLRDMERKLIIA